MNIYRTLVFFFFFFCWLSWAIAGVRCGLVSISGAQAVTRPLEYLANARGLRELSCTRSAVALTVHFCPVCPSTVLRQLWTRYQPLSPHTGLMSTMYYKNTDMSRAFVYNKVACLVFTQYLVANNDVWVCFVKHTTGKKRTNMPTSHV